MSATVLSLGAVRLVWYCLSGFFVLPNIFQIGGQGWPVFILCISNCISIKGPPCVVIGNKPGEYPSSIGSVVCSYLRCENILPLELYSLCVNVLWLSCVSCQDGSPRWTQHEKPWEAVPHKSHCTEWKYSSTHSLVNNLMVIKTFPHDKYLPKF